MRSFLLLQSSPLSLVGLAFLSLALCPSIRAQGTKAPPSYPALIVAVLKDASATADKITDPTKRAEALFELARANLVAEKGTAAAGAFRNALETVPGIASAMERGRLLANHAGVLAQLPVEARPPLRLLLSRCVSVLPTDSPFLARIAEGIAADDFTSATRIAARIPEPATRWEAIRNIARTRARNGDDAGAIAVVLKPPALQPERRNLLIIQNQADILTMLAQDRMHARHNSGDAARILDALQPLTPRLRTEKNALSASILTRIGEAQYQGGRIAEGRANLSSAFQCAISSTLGGTGSHDYEALSAIAAIYLAAGEKAEGFAALDALKSAANASPLTLLALRAADTASVSQGGKQQGTILAAIDHSRPVLGDDASILITEIQMRAGRLEEAGAEAARVEDGEKASTLLLNLAEKRIESGDSIGARANLDASAFALQRFSSPSRIPPHQEKLLRLRARSGDIDGAVLGAKTITDAKSATAAYSDILFEQLTATDYIGAQKTALGIADPGLRDRMLVNVAAWQVKATNQGFHYRYLPEDYPLWIAGDKPRRADIPAAQQTAGFIAGESYRSAALALIAQTQLALNNREGATRTAALIPDDTARAGTLAALAAARFATGDISGAEQIAAEITTVEGKVAYLEARARRKAAQGDATGAQDDYHTAATRGSATLTPERLATMQASAGKMTMALDISRRHFTQTGDREIFLNIWEAYVQRPRTAGQPQLEPQALAVQDYPREETLRRLSEWCTHRRDYGTANAVAAQIADSPQRLAAYLTLVREKPKDTIALQSAHSAALSFSVPETRFRSLLAILEAVRFDADAKREPSMATPSGNRRGFDPGLSAGR